MFLHASPKF